MFKNWIKKMKLKKNRIWELTKSFYQEREVRPEVDEVSVGENWVGFAEFLIDQVHDKGEVMLTSIANVLYLRGINQFCSASFLFALCLHSLLLDLADFGAATTVGLGEKRTRARGVSTFGPQARHSRLYPKQPWAFSGPRYSAL